MHAALQCFLIAAGDVGLVGSLPVRDLDPQWPTPTWEEALFLTTMPWGDKVSRGGDRLRATLAATELALNGDESQSRRLASEAKRRGAYSAGAWLAAAISWGASLYLFNSARSLAAARHRAGSQERGRELREQFNWTLGAGVGVGLLGVALAVVGGWNFHEYRELKALSAKDEQGGAER